MAATWIVNHITAALATIGIAPPVPQPFEDRLGKLDPSLSTLDNDIYNHQTFDWSKSGLDLLNPVRVAYFMDKLHRRISTLDSAEARKAQQPIIIVDLGCGSGIAIEAIHAAIVSSSRDPFTIQITERRTILDSDGLEYRLIGIDMSARSIELARANAKSKNLAIEYIVGDIYSLPFARGSVDAMICSDVLEHLFDLPSAFRSISEALKPNGVFSFDTINRTPTSYYLTIWILQDLLRAMQGDAHDHRLYVTPQEVHTLMQRNGLTPGPASDLVGMRPGIRFPPIAIYRLLTGQGFVSSFLAEFTLTKDLSISYLHWCEKK